MKNVERQKITFFISKNEKCRLEKLERSKELSLSAFLRLILARVN